MKKLLYGLALTALTVAYAGTQAIDQSVFVKLHPELVQSQALWERSAEARSAQVDWTITRGLVVQRRMMGANRFDGKRVVDVDLEHDEAVRFGIHDKFTLSAWILAQAPTAAIVARGKDVSHAKGYGLCLEGGKVQINLVRSWPDDALSVETETAVGLNDWHNITTTYDGSGAAGGVRIYIDGQPQNLKINLDRLHGSFDTTESLWIGGGSGPEAHFRGRLRMIRIYRTMLTSDEVSVVATQTPINAIAQIPPDKRTHGEAEKIRGYFLERGAPAEIRDAWQKLQAAN